MTTTDWNDLGIGDDDYTETDHTHYQHATQYGPPVPPGIYTLAMDPESVQFETKAEGTTAVLSLLGTAVVLAAGEDTDGRKIPFVRASSKKAGKRNASFLEDLFYALGGKFSGAQLSIKLLGQSIEEMINAGATFKGRVDWDAYCKSCREPGAKGAKDFERNDDGILIPTTKCDKCGAVLPARARVAAFIAA